MPSVATVEAFAIALEVSPVSWHTDSGCWTNRGGGLWQRRKLQASAGRSTFGKSPPTGSGLQRGRTRRFNCLRP